MARGASKALSENVITGKKKKLTDPAYEPVQMDGDLVRRKGAFSAPQLQADFKPDKVYAEMGRKYLRVSQQLTNQSPSENIKENDPYWSIAAAKETPRQRWLEIGDESIRGSLRSAGFKDWANVEGVGPDRLMASWMLNSKFFDLSGKTPVQVAPIPKGFDAGSRASSESGRTPDQIAAGVVNSNTMRMNDLRRMMENTAKTSPNWEAGKAEYLKLRTEAKKARDSITDKEDRKVANFSLRTSVPPIDSTGQKMFD